MHQLDYRSGLIALVLVCSAIAIRPLAAAETRTVRLPDDAGYANVTHPPYNIVPDGKTDCTEMLQAAILRDRAVYLPAGTYLVSDMIHFGQKEGEAKRRFIQGENRDRVIIKLKDNCETFDQPDRPKAVIRCASRDDLQAPANAFRNAVYDITIDVGKNNPGAIGIFYYAHNQGALQNVRVVNHDSSSGLVGVDMYRGLVGPCLIKNVTVEGFDYGLRIRGPVRQITLEEIAVEGQRKYGIYNNGNVLAIHRVRSRNSVPAIHNRSGWGLISLVDARLDGGAPDAAAIENENGFFYAHRVKANGYGRVFTGQGIDKPASEELIHFSSRKPMSLFPSPDAPLGLEIEDTPEVAWDDPASWVAVKNEPEKKIYADRQGKERSYDDYTKAIQAAIDSGAETVYFPPLIRETPPRNDYYDESFEALRRTVSGLLIKRVSDRLLAGVDLKAMEREARKAKQNEVRAAANAETKDAVRPMSTDLRDPLREEFNAAWAKPIPNQLRKEVAEEFHDPLAAKLCEMLGDDYSDGSARSVAERMRQEIVKTLLAGAESQLAMLPPVARQAQYHISDSILVRGKVKRLFFGEQTLIQHTDKPLLQILDGSAPVVVLERFSTDRNPEGPLNILVDTERTVVIRNAIPEQGIKTTDKPGKVFIEDVCGSPFEFVRKNVWIRHVNPEIPEVKLHNKGGNVWVMGYKSERAGIPLKTSNGGRTEVYGAMFYSTTGVKEEPAIVVENASFFGSVAESCHNGFPFETILRETRSGSVREMKHDDAYRRDGWGMAVPALIAYDGVNPTPANPKADAERNLIIDFRVLDDRAPQQENRRPDASRWEVSQNLVEDEIYQVNRQFLIYRLPDEVRGADWIRVNPESFRDWDKMKDIISFRVSRDAVVYTDKAAEGWEKVPEPLTTVYDYNLPRREPMWAKIATPDHALYMKSCAKGEEVRLAPEFTFVFVQDAQK